MSRAREKRLEKAQMRVLFQVPFFAPAVARLGVTWDETCVVNGLPTAATDGKQIRFHPDFFDALEDQKVCTVLCHEAAHCLLGHNWRAPGGVDWDVWNQACDHAVNLMLREFAEQVTAKRMADPFPMPDGVCCDPVYKGMAEERVYALLSQAKPPGDSGGTNQGQGQGQRVPFGEMDKPAGGLDKKVKSDWENTLQQCVFGVKGRGTVPAGLARFVGELLNPTIPWWEMVRQWLREKVEDDWNWMRPNRYFDDSDFILPSLDSERVGPIVFATDSSGSIDTRVFDQTHAEKQACLDDLKPSKLVDIICDAKIQTVVEYRPGDSIVKQAPGGGGTDFRPVFEYCDQLEVKPKCLVYLTDLDGTFPELEPDYPVLWIAYGGGHKAPFGEVVQAESFTEAS